MGHSGSKTASLSTAQSLGVSGKVSASTQSGRASQNFAAVIGAFTRAFQDGEINLPEIQKDLEALVVDLDKEHSPAVSLDFLKNIVDWKKGNEALFPDIQLAVYAAAEVYNLRTKQAIDDAKKKTTVANPVVDGQPAEVLDGQPHSYLANTKNWALFKDKKTGTLCFSVRGTSTDGISAVIDNLTNIDANAKLVTDFDVSAEKQPAFKVHRGFYDVANAMYSDVQKAVVAAAKGAATKPNLVFTGHSAGGGTALLLYHFFQVKAGADLNLFKAVHCFTFGSAAIATIPNPVHPSRTTDRIVSFINLKDPVPRSDLDYADWIADSLGKFLTRKAGTKVPYKTLSAQFLYPGGELVILDEDGSLVGKLGSNVLSSLAFLDLHAHGSKEYLRIVKNLLAK